MKVLLLVLLMFTTSVFAGLIPNTLYGESENGDELWTFTDTSGTLDDASFFLNAQFGDFNSFARSFGLYQYDIVNDAIINQLQIFDAAAIDSGSTSTNVILDQVANTVSSSHGSIDITLAVGLDFGFYFISDGFTSYSQSAFNGGSDYFGNYLESDPFSVFNTHIYATDNDSGDYEDWIKLSISDVQTYNVPEPTSIVLLGLALVSLGMFKLRKH